jgi:hypothetical protein
MPAAHAETYREIQASRLKTQMCHSDIRTRLSGFGGAFSGNFSRIANVKIQAQKEKITSLEGKSKILLNLNEDDLKIEELQSQIAAIKENKATTEAAIKGPRGRNPL